MTTSSAVDALSAASKASLSEAQASAEGRPRQGRGPALHRHGRRALRRALGLDAADTPPADQTSRVYRGSRTGELSPEKQFESFMLRSFVEEMLPSENSAFFGDGTAGNIWKSMLPSASERRWPAAGGIGIAEMIGQHNAAEARAASQTLDIQRAAATSAIAKGGLDVSDPGPIERQNRKIHLEAVLTQAIQRLEAVLGRRDQRAAVNAPGQSRRDEQPQRTRASSNSRASRAASIPARSRRRCGRSSTSSSIAR